MGWGGGNENRRGRFFGVHSFYFFCLIFHCQFFVSLFLFSFSGFPIFFTVFSFFCSPVFFIGQLDISLEAIFYPAGRFSCEFLVLPLFAGFFNLFLSSILPVFCQCFFLFLYFACFFFAKLCSQFFSSFSFFAKFPRTLLRTQPTKVFKYISLTQYFLVFKFS